MPVDVAPLPIARTVPALRRAVRLWRGDGARIALVPTMGALHEGHLSLVALARQHADRVVASIFVNPTQFGPGEDFAAYPRGERRDADMLAEAGVDLLFAPTVTAMYPRDYATMVAVGDVTESLCGATRPGHFDGVATVVLKLMNQCLPDIAVFGEKDWQQLVTIRRMTRDLDVAVRVLGAPILREEDGLAMSSRNRYLDEAQRAIAPKLHKILTASAALIADGADIPTVLGAARGAVQEAGFGKIDYIEARAAETLAPVETHDPSVPARLFAAVHLGRARLIDNIPVQPSEKPGPQGPATDEASTDESDAVGP